MIPARVALALQADGWWLRDEIVWHKPNPMPVSVTDRTTPAHEMLYMFSKSARYHYDMEAVKEPAVTTSRKKWTDGGSDKQRGHGRTHAGFNGRYAERIMREGAPKTRQPRSVWSISPHPFSGAHFATFPPDLIRPCILAGCPADGTVLDPFFGAGTTGLVAAELGRNAIGIELNPEYGCIAAERLGLRAVTPSGDILMRAA
jgi:DNA modification methylase